jgi:hypothetical protein
MLLLGAPLVFSILGILANERNRSSILSDNQCCGSGSGRIQNFLPDPDPKFLPDPDPESDPEYHFGSGSGQPLLGMKLKQHFSEKMHNFSTKCTI